MSNFPHRIVRKMCASLENSRLSFLDGGDVFYLIWDWPLFHKLSSV